MVAVFNIDDSFLMPDGARLVGRDGDTVRFEVSMPVDEQGFFGRQCPGCRLMFRIDADAFKAMADDAEMWCVYCGHCEGLGEFITQQQLDRATSVVGDWGLQHVRRELDAALSGLARPAPRSGWGIGVEVHVDRSPFYPRPLPGISEEQLIRVRTCAACAVRYAVFGEHRFCPACGPLPAITVATDALDAEMTRLDVLISLPLAVAGLLREQGGVTRSLVDTVKNLATIVEVLAGAVFRAAVPTSATLLQGKGNIFQRLDDTADLFMTAGYPDVRAAVGPVVWQRLLEVWAARHVFTHNDGLIDAKYLTRVPASRLPVGQRLTVSEALVRQAVDDTRTLCVALVALTAP
jgi:hypothetical protein